MMIIPKVEEQKSSNNYINSIIDATHLHIHTQQLPNSFMSTNVYIIEKSINFVKYSENYLHVCTLTETTRVGGIMHIAGL